jgi:hypothetical protein
MVSPVPPVVPPPEAGGVQAAARPAKEHRTKPAPNERPSENDLITTPVYPCAHSEATTNTMT